MLVNVRRLSEPKMVIGLTGPQAINFTGDLCLEMLNTTGKSSKIVVKDVSIMIRLCNTTCLASLTFHELVMLPHFRLLAIKSQAQQGHSTLSKRVVCMHYPVSGTALAAFGVSTMNGEELMHLRMNHCVCKLCQNAASEQICARGLNPQLECTKRQCNICVHAHSPSCTSRIDWSDRHSSRHELRSLRHEQDVEP